MVEISELLNKIDDLEKENTYLKALLENAGISYTQVDPTPHSPQAIFNENQGGRIVPVKITHKHVQAFFSYFWGRMDVFSKRYPSKTTGKTGYFPQCNNFWKYGVCPKASGTKVKCKDCHNRAWTKLQASHIEAHLIGKRDDASDVIGIYPLFPDGTCRFLVFDFDNHDKGSEENDNANLDESWIEEVDALRKICTQAQIPTLTERSRSGRGAHVWIFFDSPIEASLARRFGTALLDKGAESVNLKSFKYYDRMLPAQDIVENGEVGNLIALPLQGQAIRNGNSAFIDENWNAFPNQWKALLSTQKLSKQQVEDLIADCYSERNNNINTHHNDDTKPWERTSAFHKEDVNGNIKVVLSNEIYICRANLKPRIQNQIRRLAAFSNPKFYKNKAIGFSNYTESRFIYLGYDENGYICIPRGLMETLQERCDNAGIHIEFDDKRSCGRPLDIEFNGELRDNQKDAIAALTKYDNGILSAATAFGKTVTCSGIISQIKTSTLIILESSALVEQWEKALSTFLTINEELPEYQTKTGRTKKRKSVIGIIHGAKDTSTGIIDIAMAGSLCKKGEYHSRLKEYGLVLVDECHHSASSTLRSVLREINAKYIYGVTATPFRGDGLEKIIFMLLGAIRYKYSAKEKAAEQGISHFVVPRFTRTVSPHGREKLHVNDAYELIRDNEIRNDQIIADIKSCIENGRTPVVLTKYKDHVAKLYEKVKSYAKNVFLLTGTKSKKEQKAIIAAMEQVPENESLILIATGQLIGEGFDYPRLDTLILATPVAWKGIVEQYAGRLNRDYAGKENVMIYDYVDIHIPVFDKMYAKRLKAYKRIGYQLYTGETPEKQESNSIFDSETYLAVYEKDLKNAIKDIVISSPTLGKYKVHRMISLLKERQESGVKVTIVTWHPEVYKYGKDEHRIELMELLRNTGFNIELMNESCQHYAVIDGEIVWYGSMNLLSKDDVEDNIMRVSSKAIATELLEMTFRKDSKLHEYQLPLDIL
ncbi:MAG: DEAD/DEAH box helicase family protein [Ruminococcus sp.]|uniref:TOTE conflict system archaeo-eukaryotic primase domain-containing protein n=1 Tax=Ruminococcus sp. TaxID=41978 RepID=UPI0025F04C9F|nr:DEAD/DEAH box helicase family protein [Ruminococcus sp.]MBO4867330.1 DEAD/DEAH box helicase family protein [Ruminococcus sp.]